MKHIYRIANLGCADCAGKIERDANALPGVIAAEINYAVGKITVELDAAADPAEVAARLGRLVTAIEPEARLELPEDRASSQHHAGHDHNYPGSPRFTIVLLIAAFAAGWYLSHNGYDRTGLGLFIGVYLAAGYRVLLSAFRNLFTRNLFDENLLMTLATAGAWALGDSAEAAAVMLLFHIGEYFQGRAVEKSRRSISQLMDIRPAFANLIRNGKPEQVNPEEVMPGDRILVKPGERIPLDGKVISGASRLDTSALTGESVPVGVSTDSPVLSGAINLTSSLEIEVSQSSADSTVSRILAEVENAAARKSRSEHYITRFARIYTPLVFGAALLLAILPPLLGGGEWSEWIRRALIFLVISCPCALVISVPLTFFAGIGGASRRGILFKGGNYLETLAAVKTMVFDKTGTLTHGTFEVTNMEPADGVTEQELLELAVRAESHSTHPIAESLRKAWGRPIAAAAVGHAEEKAGRGIAVTVDGHPILAGNRLLLEESGIEIPAGNVTGSGTVVYFARDGKFLGAIQIADRVKPNAAAAMNALRRSGVSRLVMLTGDRKTAAQSIAAELGLDEIHAELLPADKVRLVETELKHLTSPDKLAFVGDGINDAPVLARSDVGIAMGGLGSDAAVESADVVLMTDDLMHLPLGIHIARRTVAIVKGNIFLALGVKVAVLTAGALGFVTMWGAVFADVGVCLLAILNALRALHIKYNP